MTGGGGVRGGVGRGTIESPWNILDFVSSLMTFSVCVYTPLSSAIKLISRIAHFLDRLSGQGEEYCLVDTLLEQARSDHT